MEDLLDTAGPKGTEGEPGGTSTIVLNTLPPPPRLVTSMAPLSRTVSSSVKSTAPPLRTGSDVEDLLDTAGPKGTEGEPGRTSTTVPITLSPPPPVVTSMAPQSRTVSSSEKSTTPPVCTVSPTLSTAPQSRTVHSVNVAAPLASKQHNVVSSELMDSVENTIDEFLNENLPGAPVFTSDEEDEPFSVLPRLNTSDEASLDASHEVSVCDSLIIPMSHPPAKNIKIKMQPKRTSSPANTSEIVIPSDDEECDLLRSKLQKKSQSKSQYIDSDQADDSDRDVTFNPQKEIELGDSDEGCPTKKKKKVENLKTKKPSKSYLPYLPCPRTPEENQPRELSSSSEDEVTAAYERYKKKPRYERQRTFASDEKEIYQVVVQNPSNKDLSHNKLQFCTFCQQADFSNFARHLLDFHGQEDEVKSIKLYPAGNGTRGKLISLLRTRGNHDLNMRTLRNGKGMFVPVKRMSPGRKWKVSEYSPCPNCQAWFSGCFLWKHQRRCPARYIQHLPTSIESQIPLVVERELQLHSDMVAGRISIDACEELKNEVFTNMKNDEISKLAKSDSLICGLGNASMERNIGNKTMRRYNVSSDMRLAARCLGELRDLQETEEAQKNLTWYDALIPSQYDNIVQAVFRVCRENVMDPLEEEEDFDVDDLEAPSNAIKLSYDIARLSSLKITKAINLEDKKLGEKTRKETNRFIEKFNYNWSTDVKKRARHVLRERKLNATVELPDPKDIARFATYMKQKMEEAQQPRTIDEFRELQYDILARLIAYNRRRPGEVQVLRYV